MTEEIECDKCQRTFTTTFTDHSYYIDGWRKPEYEPDEEDCEFCRGEEDCAADGCKAQATVLNTESGVDFYCVKHWEEEREDSDCTPEEWEEFAHHLEIGRHDKPKEEAPAEEETPAEEVDPVFERVCSVMFSAYELASIDELRLLMDPTFNMGRQEAIMSLVLERIWAHGRGFPMRPLPGETDIPSGTAENSQPKKDATDAS